MDYIVAIVTSGNHERHLTNVEIDQIINNVDADKKKITIPREVVDCLACHLRFIVRLKNSPRKFKLIGGTADAV